MKIIDSHIHLGNIFGLPESLSLEERSPDTRHPNRPNIYEQLGYRNIYLGSLNYLFKPLIASSAKISTRYGNVANLLDSMKNAGIERSVVLPIEPYVKSDSILTLCRKYAQLIAFCSVHPYDRDKRTKLQRYFKAGARGLKIHPVIQCVSPQDRATFELLEEVRIYNAPVLFHVGWGSIGRGRYGLINNYRTMLENFPDIRFIFAHMGFYDPGHFLQLAKLHDNVFCDTSWQPARIIRKAIDCLGQDRIILGSDWPYSLQGTSLNIILKVTAGKPALREKLLYKNAASLLQML